MRSKKVLYYYIMLVHYYLKTLKIYRYIKIMAVDVKEYAAFTGVTEGYAEEILKDAEHAKWHIPSGAAKLEKAAELIADIEGTEDEAVVKPDEVTEPGTPEVVTETDPDGGSVEGEA